jgi:outer membrane autotransporter protein
LNAAGGVSGSFTTVTQSSPYANGTVDYGPDLVALGIQSFEVSPDNDSVYGDLGNLALLQADQANSSLLRRLDGLSSGLGVEGANLLANPTTDSGRRTGAWERNSGYSYRINQDGPVAGYYAQGGGITAGMDQRWGKALGGFSVGDGSTDLTLADGESGTIGSPNANLYGALDLGVVDLGASVGYAYDSFSATRPITSVMQTASGSYTGQEESGAIQAGIPLSAGGVALLPKAGVEYAHLSDAGFTESGATVFDLAVAGHDSNSLRPFLGLTLNKGFVLGAWRFCPNVDMGWSYETMNEGLQGTATAGGESFTLAGQTPAPGEFSAGGGFSAQVAGDFSLNTDYQTLLPIGNAREQTLSIGLRYQFGAAAPGSLVPAGN